MKLLNKQKNFASFNQFKNLKDSLKNNPDIEKFTSEGNTFDFNLRIQFAPLVHLSLDISRYISMTLIILIL